MVDAHKASEKSGASEKRVMEITDPLAAIAWQARHAEEAGAPITGRVLRAQAALLNGAGELGIGAVGARIANWPGLSLEDALPLRVAGGIHFLHLTGAAPELAPIYAGEVRDSAEVGRIIAGVAARLEGQLLPWLDNPPQTNEAGRSSSVMAALLWLAPRIGPDFALFEIGASAGINTMMDRYAYDLAGILVEPSAARTGNSPLRLVPEWRGPPPPQAEVRIAGIKGCDIAPVDLADPAQALRLKAYIWADAADRMARMDSAIALAAAQKPDLVAADAADFVARSLSLPQPAGTARVLFHTVMWQYLPPDTRAAITAAMEAAGAAATPARPLGWIRLETNRTTFRHELEVRYWRGDGGGGGGAWRKLAEAHPHGAWVEWLG